MGRQAVMPLWHSPQLTDLQSELQPLILVLKPHLKLLTGKTKPKALHPHSEKMPNCIYEVSSFCPVVLIKELNVFPCQKETRRFRQSGAAAAGLKINSGEVNGKANTSGWQLEGSGSAQHDNISKLSFSPLWPSHLPLAPTLLPPPKKNSTLPHTARLNRLTWPLKLCSLRPSSCQRSS